MYSLPVPLLFAITIVACCVRSVFSGCYSKRVASDNYHTWLFGLLQGAFCLITIVGIFLVSGGLGNFSCFSVGLGAFMGAIDVISLVTMLKAMAIGPFSYTVIITSLGAVIPTLSGYFFPNDPTPTAVQYFGVAMMIVCLLLSPENSKRSDEKKLNFKWLLLSGLSAICCGTIGVVQKIHQTSDYNGESAAMLVGAFVFSMIFSLVMLLFEKRNKAPESPKNSKLIWLGIPAISGFFFAFQHTINLKLSSGPAIIVFPLLNLSPMIISMAAGFIIFKEKLTAKRWVGLACGVLSSIFVSGIIKF